MVATTPGTAVAAEEREALQRTVREFLEDKSPEAEVRRLMETPEGYDPAVWAQMADQLGLQGLAIPEEFGGSGFGQLELSAVFEEMGAALLAAPFLATVGLAANALLAAGDDAAMKEHLPGIASGQTIATVALTETGSGWREDDVTVRATRDGGAYRIEGVKPFVLDGALASLVLVAARSEDGVGLYAVAGDAAGLRREPMVTMDQTRKMAQLSFDGTPATLIGAASGWAAIERALQLAGACLAAESLGGAARCLQMSSGYAQERIQFGRPIGSFQAIKHKLANMLTEVEQARSASFYAAREIAEDGADAGLAASIAKAYCTDAFFHAAADTIQIHGGIGFTWEHPAHLYFKRAKTNQLLLGDPTYHRGLVAERVGI